MRRAVCRKTGGFWVRAARIDEAAVLGGTGQAATGAGRSGFLAFFGGFWPVAAAIAGPLEPPGSSVESNSGNGGLTNEEICQIAFIGVR